MSSYAIPLPPPLTRATSTILPPSPNTPSFLIGSSQKSYKHQYSNIYFIRLRLLKGFVEKHARQKWNAVAGNPTLIPRVLDVEKGRLCYVVGTVYMDMPLKPNVMIDIARDQSIPPPPPPSKFCSAEDDAMLEDESGRIRLVGDRIRDARLVTGVIIGALGMETPNGDFEVIDLCYAEMAPQSAVDASEEDEMDVDGQDGQALPDEWIATISGLDVGSNSPADAQIQMLVEYLVAEGGGIKSQESATCISRLIIAGNSLASIASIVAEPGPTIEDRKARRFGYDSTSFSSHPILSLSSALSDIASAMPIHILPGESDPAGTIMPQQPFPRAMFGEAARYPTFICETNPTYLTIASNKEARGSSPKTTQPSMKRNLLINSGQPLNDMFKYLPSPPNTRLSILESTLRWRHMAPTAPDTLWCHPYFAEDPFLIKETPDIYIVGGQKKFATKLVTDHQKQKGKPSTRCRVIMVPSFAHTGILVLVNLRTLAVRCINFSVHGMTAGGKTESKDEASRPRSPTPLEPQSSGPESLIDSSMA